MGLEMMLVTLWIWQHPTGVGRWVGEGGGVGGMGGGRRLLLPSPLLLYGRPRYTLVREDVKIPHSRMTTTCWETLVTCL